jgi:hypothetical protein
VVVVVTYLVRNLDDEWKTPLLTFVSATTTFGFINVRYDTLEYYKETLDDEWKTPLLSFLSGATPCYYYHPYCMT